jgi:hypothetical protein
MEHLPDGRISIPLTMFPENLDILLDAGKDGEPVACNGVSLKHSGLGGVVLMFSYSDEQKLAALKRGMKFGGVIE